ncbi:hypothetical protein [Streptomyces sp. NPDC047071]|uniref:hypothetical protein n=1 Tax=Streptomyces sp. NPDC047071 TaxID=3154808 RepID=UPI0034527312
MDWLRGCVVDRIAWVARGVADAGWTVAEVQGWLHLRGGAGRVRRGSGLLAVLLAGAEQVLDTPAKRADAVARWHGAQEAARRHRIEQVRVRAEKHDGAWQAPSNCAVRRAVEAAFAQAREAAAVRRQEHGPGSEEQAAESVLGVRDFAEAEVARARAEASAWLVAGDASVVTVIVDSMGRASAEQLYRSDLVERAMRLASGANSATMTYTHR